MVADPFAIGTTFEGYCIVNPTAPDTNPYAAGNFDGAVIEFAVRAGPIGSPLTGFATSGVAFVSDNSVDQLLLITDDFEPARGRSSRSRSNWSAAMEPCWTPQPSSRLWLAPAVHSTGEYSCGTTVTGSRSPMMPT